MRLGFFTVTKRNTNTTYQIKDNKNPEYLRTVHRNHLIEYFHKEETLPTIIAEYTTPTVETRITIITWSKLELNNLMFQNNKLLGISAFYQFKTNKTRHSSAKGRESHRAQTLASFLLRVNC